MIVIRFLHTVFGWFFILLLTMFLACFIVVAGDRDFSEKVLKVWSRVWLAVVGAKVRFQQHPAIEKQKSYVYVSNHTSNLDVPCILASSDHPLRFIAKKELQRIPVFGWAARRMGHVFIDRKDSRGAARAIQKRIDRGLQGVGLFFFAEGTRSTTEDLLPFKKGAAIAAIETGLDCVPIAVVGARDVLKPKGFALFHPGTIAVVFGEPVPVKGHTLDERDALVAEQRVAVERTIAEGRALLRPKS
ncbi:MAG TPA: lysophospholipid acyltransferase family protein [Myxococcales bacterium]|jgi:1-acyl-sn-glycerol-3-phosphate acyltransferase|nr:lysophospholipid acyltransferase family protein [Myxococcales bacterium]